MDLNCVNIYTGYARLNSRWKCFQFIMAVSNAILEYVCMLEFSLWNFNMSMQWSKKILSFRWIKSGNFGFMKMQEIPFVHIYIIYRFLCCFLLCFFRYRSAFYFNFFLFLFFPKTGKKKREREWGTEENS